MNFSKRMLPSVNPSRLPYASEDTFPDNTPEFVSSFNDGVKIWQWFQDALKRPTKWTGAPLSPSWERHPARIPFLSAHQKECNRNGIYKKIDAERNGALPAPFTGLCDYWSSHLYMTELAFTELGLPPYIHDSFQYETAHSPITRSIVVLKNILKIDPWEWDSQPPTPSTPSTDSWDLWKTSSTKTSRLKTEFSGPDTPPSNSSGSGSSEYNTLLSDQSEFSVSDYSCSEDDLLEVDSSQPYLSADTDSHDWLSAPNGWPYITANLWERACRNKHILEGRSNFPPSVLAYVAREDTNDIATQSRINYDSSTADIVREIYIHYRKTTAIEPFAIEFTPEDPEFYAILGTVKGTEVAMFLVFAAGLLATKRAPPSKPDEVTLLKTFESVKVGYFPDANFNHEFNGKGSFVFILKDIPPPGANVLTD